MKRDKDEIAVVGRQGRIPKNDEDEDEDEDEEKKSYEEFIFLFTSHPSIMFYNVCLYIFTEIFLIIKGIS